MLPDDPLQRQNSLTGTLAIATGQLHCNCAFLAAPTAISATISRVIRSLIKHATQARSTWRQQQYSAGSKRTRCIWVRGSETLAVVGSGSQPPALKSKPASSAQHFLWLKHRSKRICSVCTRSMHPYGKKKSWSVLNDGMHFLLILRLCITEISQTSKSLLITSCEHEHFIDAPAFAHSGKLRDQHWSSWSKLVRHGRQRIG